MPSPILYLEPIGGIAGDMFLAAALDLGVDLKAVQHALSGLSVGGFDILREKAERHHIFGTHVDVKPHHDSHEHSHRALSDIRQIIERAPTLSAGVKAQALKVFQLLGEAEAHIHQVPIDTIHFHEVGAVDSIVDICGAAVVLELLGNPEVYCAPPPMGSGTVEGAHGRIPVPAPATLELLRGLPVRFEGMGETTTPTGAALLKAFARIEAPPPMVVEKVGYGVGTKDFSDRANVLRVSLGHSSEQRTPALQVVEANLDDATPQLLAWAMEKLLQHKALDVWVAPVTMKKGRPGHVLSALCRQEDIDAVADVLFSETPTLGIRFHPVERLELTRVFKSVETPWGPVRLKVGLWRDKVQNVHPEFEECRILAEKHGVPLKEVMAQALAAYSKK